MRFVETDDAIWALKELPQRIAAKEYAVLRDLERRSLPAVRPAGLVIQPHEDTAILVTRYLDRSWQYRRLLMRLPPDASKHRERLLDAMASLLVDLHRNGVFWGDCSLANTLFSRDGQILQAFLVDAETSEIHPQLSDGQRQYDIDILVENVAAGMMDLAVRLEQPPEVEELLIEEACSVATRYQALRDVLHAQPVFAFGDRYQIEGQIRRLHDLGFAVDEVKLESAGESGEKVRLKVAVAAHRFHATQLHDLTSLDVGEGQARILLGDLRAYQAYARQAHPELTDARCATLARRGAPARDGAGTRGGGRARRPDPGVLRSAGGALAAQRAGRARRRRRGGARRAPGSLGPAAVGGEDGDRGGADRHASGPHPRAGRRALRRLTFLFEA
ncbi:DUF4032 domain-containing protein [Dactylosporangium darangshiense]